MNIANIIPNFNETEELSNSLPICLVQQSYDTIEIVFGKKFFQWPIMRGTLENI
jgi:hypothetical protein